ncbi:ATP-binding cassette domain-containing protein [bacterium]|nr:ATP-binding cassette domain-containing protein [bacterium]
MAALVDPSRLALHAKNVSLRRDGRSLLSDVCWQVERGRRSALLGPNGSGKTTLLRIVTGYLYPTSGQITVLGERIGQTNLDDLRRRIGIVDPTSVYLDGQRMPALDVVLSGFFGHLTIDFDDPTPEQHARARALLAQVGLAHRESQLFATLSTGEQRRVLVARALTTTPELLVLDEATAGLDLLAREEFLASVERMLTQQPGVTLLVVTHHLEDLPSSVDDILLLAEGTVRAHGRPEETLTDGILSGVFGVAVQADRANGRWSWRIVDQSRR